MSDPDLKKFVALVRDVVKEELEPVAEQVTGIDKQVTGLTEQVTGLTQAFTGLGEEVTSITEQVSYLTERVDGEIIPTLEVHTKYLKKMTGSQEKNEDNIIRLDKRLSETEAKLGIQAPPEHQIIQ